VDRRELAIGVDEVLVQYPAGALFDALIRLADVKRRLVDTLGQERPEWVNEKIDGFLASIGY